MTITYHYEYKANEFQNKKGSFFNPHRIQFEKQRKPRVTEVISTCSLHVCLHHILVEAIPALTFSCHMQWEVVGGTKIDGETKTHITPQISRHTPQVLAHWHIKFKSAGSLKDTVSAISEFRLDSDLGQKTLYLTWTCLSKTWSLFYTMKVV